MLLRPVEASYTRREPILSKTFHVTTIHNFHLMQISPFKMPGRGERLQSPIGIFCV